MPKSMTCPECDATIDIAGKEGGKKVRCPSCEAVVVVPTRRRSVDDADDETPRKKATGSKQQAGSKKGSKTLVVLLVIFGLGGLLLVGTCAGGCYMLKRAFPKPTIEPSPETKASLKEFLSGTKWNWLTGDIEFKADGSASHATWTQNGWTVRWEAIDRRTVLLAIEQGRLSDRFAVLQFDDEMLSYDVFDFVRAERHFHLTRPDRLVLVKPNPAAEKATDLERQLHGTKWDWGDAPIVLQPNGIVGHPHWDQANLTVRWQAVDRRTALLILTVGRTVDVLAICEFTEDLKSFAARGFDMKKRMDVVPRIMGEN